MISLRELRTSFWVEAEIAGSIAIVSHVEPDGDGFAASLALQRLLYAKGFSSVIVVDEPMLSRFEHLTQDALVRVHDPSEGYELLIVLDCNSYDRLGPREELVEGSRKVILMDHHIPEGRLINADTFLIDTSFAAVGMIIFATFEQDIVALSDEDKIYIGNCLYTTILNDTNNFVNANTNPAVFEAAARITELGIKPHELYKAYFFNQTASEMRYVGQVLSTIELLLNQQLLFLHSDLQMELENSIDNESILSITRYVQSVKDIKAIIYCRETALGEYKVSLRSVHLDVNKIARKYGGGGHRSASGCQIKADLHNLKLMLTKDFEEQLS